MNVFDLLGEENIKSLVNTFYKKMDEDSRFQFIREMHPKSLKGSEEKLYLFLVGWLGGPPLYHQKYGHPRLRARHLPFQVSSEAQDQWVVCMKDALFECKWEISLGSKNYNNLVTAIVNLADFMRNQPD